MRQKFSDFKSLIILLFIITASFLVNCKNNNYTEGYKIKGEIRNSNDEVLYLSQVNDNELVIIDSCKIEEHCFSFSGKVELPELYYISDVEYQNYIPVFIENSEIEFYAKNLQFSDLKINGSTVHQEFSDFQESFSVYQKKYSYFLNQITDTTLLLKDSTYQTIKTERVNFLKNYVQINKNSIVSLYVIYKILMHDLPKNEIIEIMSQYSGKLKNSKYYIYINNFINK